LARRTISRQWPPIRALLDDGRPAPLGVVTVASPNPLLLGRNHQVLAYGYTVDGPAVTLALYDPNSGPDDGIVIRFSTGGGFGGCGDPVLVRGPVRGFLLTRYTPAKRPVGGPLRHARSHLEQLGKMGLERGLR